MTNLSDLRDRGVTVTGTALSEKQCAAAARLVKRNARDEDDAQELLEALGLAAPVEHREAS
ncbi:hypothetical protein ACF1BE_19670 [Streptomyces sp. NPDC014991]|uniref:hypothetical protein n=1 Tax=Streptomyces sp. NPDC014991 TaxID=3364935 RepID=UPI0036FABF74